MTLKLIEGSSFEDIAQKAQEACKSGPVINLLLHGVFKLADIECDFIQAFLPRAEKWQAGELASDLILCHGQYMNRADKPGREFIVDELRRKRDSNRACVSLIDMKDLVGSGDQPIPSFMVLQFSFIGDGFKTLQATAYFRALEVCNFLPINIAEICDVVGYIGIEFPDLEEFYMTIMAFRAHFNPRFDCHTKSALDMATDDDVTRAVEELDYKQLIEWLDSKITVEPSFVCTTGLEHLLEALSKKQNSYPKSLVRFIREALKATEQLRKVREGSSHSDGIAKRSQKARGLMRRARKLLEDMMKKLEE